MRARIKFAPYLVALAMLATACGGGGESTPQAADLIPTPVPIAEGDFDFVEEARSGTSVEAVEGEEEVEPEAIAELAAVSLQYETPQDRAMSMVLTPDDLSYRFGILTVDVARTDEVTNLYDAFDLVGRSDGTHGATDGRLTGYRLTADTRFSESVTTEVHVYADAESAAARVAAEKALYDDGVVTGAESVELVEALPGGAFVADFGERAEVWFAGDAVVGRAEVEGVAASTWAVDVAKQLGLRIYRVGEELVAPRDPYPADGEHHSPHRKLERFAADASLVVRDDAGERLGWWRASGVYEGREHFSCRVVDGRPGSEQMVADLMVDGVTAELWTEESPERRELDATDPDVLAALDRCPTFQAELARLFIVDMDYAEIDRGATPLGSATSYRTVLTATESGDVEFAGNGEEEARFVAYLDADGWLAATDMIVQSTAGEVDFDFSGVGADEPVTVATQFNVTGIGEDLVVAGLGTYQGMHTLELVSEG